FQGRSIGFQGEVGPHQGTCGRGRDGLCQEWQSHLIQGKCGMLQYPFRLWGNQNEDENGQFPRLFSTETGEFLRQVFTAAVNEKATKIRGKDFDRVWREKPPAFMPR